MKVIYVTTESLMDHSFTIASELRKHIHLSVYISAKRFSEEINEFCTKLDAVFVRRSRFINPISLLRELVFLNSLRRRKCDVIWFNTFSVYQALFVKLFIRNFLVNTHDAELHPEEKDLHGIFARWLTFKLHKKKVCLASKTQASMFKKRFGTVPRIFQLPIIDYYEAVSSKESHGAASAGNSIRFFFFGTILPYKGIEILLGAAELLAKSGIDFRLNIYGKITYSEREITRRVQSSPQIHLVNNFISYKEVYNIFAKNDVIILPYLHVTQCGPLLIAYNQNIPAISTDLPGFREYVDDARSGLLFAATAEDLSEKMKMIIKDPSMINDMKQYIIEDIKPRFSMEAQAAHYASNFE